ncbi:carbohydrate ABC transporter permease [Candidatus Poriferisodalis sp.]|uniref:carbohydrate ABC transporter permease n=1 Tax=Candidatus Poriferisodalis sp. TaxID=3101277 RepID=UPI003B52B070
MTPVDAVDIERLPSGGGSADRQIPRPKPATRRWSRQRPILVFIAPATIIYSVFMVYPLLDSLRRSFFDDDGNYAGLANYDTLFTNPAFSDRFWGALGHNFQFFAFHMVLQNPIGLVLAVLLTAQSVRGLNIYRTLIFLPTTLSVVIVGFIWRLILSPLWGVTESIGIDTPLLGESGTVLPTLSLISVWQWVGIPMIFFYAVLIAIPKDLIEAARVDGAGSWQVFRDITLPLILPMLGIVSVLTYIGNFNAFDLIFQVKGIVAGPDYASDIMGTFFYRTFFGASGTTGSAAMGATVASVMFLIILVGVLLYMFGWQRRVSTYEL